MQHTPRVVDDFVDVDTHCVTKSKLVVYGSRRLCSRVRCVSVVVSQRDKMRYYKAINVTGEHSDAAKTFLLASSAWWGRAQGCGCGWSRRKGPPRSFYRSAFVTLYICFL